MKKVKLLIILTIIGCIGYYFLHYKTQTKQIMKFAISADYPPFEYLENGQITGFDIDLARAIAQKLDKEAVFEDMQFSNILPAVDLGRVDAGISAITITEERKKLFDFSNAYHFDKLAAVFKTELPVKSKSDLIGKKTLAQLGTTQEIWLRKNFPNEKIILIDTNNKGMEMLKNGAADLLILGDMQAKAFANKSEGFSYAIIGQTDDGCGILLKKNSDLKEKIDLILDELSKSGEIEKLRNKWFK